MDWRHVGAAALSLLFADTGWAQTASRPMVYGDAIVCHAVYTVVLAKAGVAGQTGNTKADAYKFFARRAASQLGATQGKSALQIEADLTAGVGEIQQMVGEGADGKGMTGVQRLYVYADVCFGIFDAKQNRRLAR